MRRITPDEVVEAYRKTGLRPSRSVAFDEAMNCGCGLGAICLANGGSKEGLVEGLTSYAREFVVESLGIDECYSEGFWHGFDGVQESRSGALFQTGYADGRAAAALVFGATP